MVEAAAQKSSGRYTGDLICKYAQAGTWQIWLVIADDGIAAVTGTEVITYDTGLKALAMRFCTGRGRRHWQHLVDDILAWGKSIGCTLAEGSFRIGWRRALPGWLHTHDCLERIL